MVGLPLDTIGLGIVLVMLLSLMFALLMQQRERSQKTMALWLGSLVIGALFGSAGTLGVLRLRGVQHVVHVPAEPAMDDSFFMADASDPDGERDGASTEEESRRRALGGPNPPRDLTTLVRKLDLLTGDIAIVLTAEQSALVTRELADIETADALADEDAQVKIDAVMAQLNEDQQARLDAIGLPRGPRGGEGRGRVPGEGVDEQANPFQQEVNAQALGRLRQRLNP